MFECEYLVESNGEVRRCKHRMTYVLIDKSNDEVIEVLCTQHAEKMFNENLIGDGTLRLYYTRKNWLIRTVSKTQYWEQYLGF